MKIQRTTINEEKDKAIVEMLIADVSDENVASEMLSIRVVIPADPNPLFAGYQRVALKRAREILSEQIQANSTRTGQYA